MKYQKSTQKQTQRQLNWPLLVVTLVVVAGGTIGLYALNRFQVPKLSAAFLQRADDAEADGDLNTASRYLLRYIQSVDSEVLDPKYVVRMAETVSKSATDASTKRNAIKWYYRAIGVADQDAQLHGQLARLLMETGQFSLAEEQATLGLKIEADHKGCQIVQVLSQYGAMQMGRTVEIEKITQRLAELNRRYPNEIKLATALAQVYRQVNAPTNETVFGESADRVMDAMVATSDNDFEAHLARHLYRVKFNLPEAEADIQSAQQLAPEEPKVILAAANWARKEKKYGQALESYQSLTRLDPANRNAHLGIGECLLAMGKTNMAIQAWNDGLMQGNLNDLAINVRLTDTLISFERLSEADAALRRISQALQQLTSQGNESIRDWGVAAHALLQAKLKIARLEYHDAIPLLRRVAVTTKSQVNQNQSIELAYQAWSWLGQCYWHLRQWEDSAVSYENALSEFPSSNSTRIAAARSWAAVGRIEKALLLAEQAALRQNASDSALVLLARLRLQQQLQSPSSNRDWTQFNKVLKLAETRAPDSWELPLHRVSQLFASKGHQSIGRCMELLLEAESAHQQDKAFLAQAVLTYQTLGLESEADRVLSKLDSITNTSFEALLVRSELLAHRGDFEQAMKTLDSIETENRIQQQKLVDSKIGLSLWAGDYDRVRKVLEQQAALMPRNIQVLSQLAELALRENQWDDATTWKQKLYEVEGNSGSLWRYFEARILLDSKKDLAESDLEKLWSLHEELDRIRPWWPGNTLLKAMISDRKNEPQAIDLYVAALNQGLRTPEVYRRLIQLLQQAGKLVEAEEYVGLMLREHAPSQSISGLAISKASQKGQLQLALDLAKKNVQRDPSNPTARVWFAKTLLANNRVAAAKEQLDAAQELAPNDLQVYSAIFIHRVSTNQIQQARELLAEIEANTELPETRKHFVLAQSYQLLKDRRTAESHYQQLLQKSPNNIDFLVRYAMFLAKHDPARAEQIARQATSLDASNDAARRTLAVVLSRSKDPQAWQQAQQLLDYLPQQSSATDQRLNAILLLRRGGESDLKQAEAILTKLISNSDPSADDRQMLAALLEQRGAIKDADEQFQAILATDEVSSKHLSAYIEFLFRQKRFDDVNSWLVKLEKQASNSMTSVRLRAEWMRHQDKVDQIKPFVEKFAGLQLGQIENSADRQRFMLRVARLFSDLGQTEASNAWLARLNETYPGNEGQLALHLAKNRQIKSALDLCVDALEKEPSASMTIVLAKVLLFGSNNDQMDPDLDKILDNAVVRFPDDGEVLFYVANANLKYGKTDKALGLYRKLVEVNPKHTLAWNNIAALLAEDPNKLDEALACVDRAIDEAGYSIPMLLDTKANILMQKGENESAAEILKDVVTAANGNDPRFHFRLSVALHRVGKKQQAQQSYQDAINLGLSQTFLTRSEQEALTELQKEFQ